MAIESGFSHEKLWFSIVMLVYQRVVGIKNPKKKIWEWHGMTIHWRSLGADTEFFDPHLSLTSSVSSISFTSSHPSVASFPIPLLSASLTNANQRTKRCMQKNNWSMQNWTNQSTSWKVLHWPIQSANSTVFGCLKFHPTKGEPREMGKSEIPDWQL